MDQRPPEARDTGSLGPDERARALDLVRRSVESFVTRGERPDLSAPSPLSLRRASAFVTLTLRGRLRGCIGSLNPREPLERNLLQCAVAAASEDPRFPPVSKDELPWIHYEISVLSPLRRAHSPDEVEVGRHGLFVELGDRQGLLLPQVAREHGWDRMRFLEEVCRKAGLPAEAWRRPDCRLSVFSAEVFGTESDEAGVPPSNKKGGPGNGPPR